jgi:alpha-glucosidase
MFYSKKSIAKTASRGLLVAGVVALLTSLECQAASTKFDLKSPDGKVMLSVESGDRLKYTVTFHGKQVVGASSLGITVDGRDLGQNVVLAGKPETKEIYERYATRGVHSTAMNHCWSAILPMTGGDARTPW